MAVGIIVLRDSVKTLDASLSTLKSAAMDLIGRFSRLTPSEVPQTYKGAKLITDSDDFAKYAKEFLDDDALKYAKEVMGNDADDVAKMQKVAQLAEDGSKKIGRKLSKEELKAGLNALWDDGGVEGALVEIESCFKRGGKFISEADRLKINAWKNTPSDDLYLKYKDVFDNPKYYNQKTGDICWPKNNGFKGTPQNEILKPGTIIDRYGSNTGKYTSPVDTPYEMRALAPGTDQNPYSVYEVVKPIQVKSGEIAPWFEEPGGGIQYLLPETVKDLLESGAIRRIK